MLLECESCGAPLDVADDATAVRCHYCGRRATLERFRKVAPQTPAGFVPPRQWTPPESASVPSRPLRYRPARRTAGFGAMTVLLVAGAAAFVAWRARGSVDPMTITTDSAELKSVLSQAMSVASSAVELAKQNGLGSSITGDTVPVVCSGSEHVTITGKTLAMPAGIPVVANGACTLELVDCTVSGVSGVSENGNATVRIRGGSVTAKGPAVVLTGNSTLDVSGGTTLSGDMTITATANARATVHDSTVTSAHVAVHASGNATVDTTSSRVTGRVIGGRHGAR
ncbi:MAG TPA: hypothetical protein VHU80_25020 [Polyangiaceae bacterium]|jgi:DNA-directed RNA polymerase subunit RPC12/RpoP|nr:hypothetical protein [Polyangiaceae bacterium]